MPNLCAKNFSEFATVQEPIETSDGAGGYTPTWARKCDIWAMVEESGGSEGVVASRLQTTTSLVFTTHYRDDITTKDRIFFEDKYFNIFRVENIDRKDQFLAVYANGGVAS